MGLGATDAAFYCALLAFLAAAVLDTAFRPDERTRFTKRLVTQRRRYGYALFAESLFVAADVWLLLIESPSRLWTAVRGLFGLFGPVSLILDAGLVLALMGLLAIPFSFLYIYRRPVAAAYWSRSRKGYCPTPWRRDKCPGFVTESQLMQLEGPNLEAFAGIEPQDFGAPLT